MYKTYRAKSFSGKLCWPPSYQERFVEQSNQFSLTFPFFVFVGKLSTWHIRLCCSQYFCISLPEREWHWKNGWNPGSAEVRGNMSLISETSEFHPVMRMAVPYYQRSVHGVKLNPRSSKQDQTTLFVCQVLHFLFYQGNCRQFCSREQDVLCL